MMLDQQRVSASVAPEHSAHFGGDKMMKLLRSIIAVAGLSFVLPASQSLADNTPRPSPTNPALTSSVDDPGRIPYQVFTFIQCSGNICLQNLPAAPAGKRLVIQHWGFQLVQQTGTNSVI